MLNYDDTVVRRKRFLNEVEFRLISTTDGLYYLEVENYRFGPDNGAFYLSPVFFSLEEGEENFDKLPGVNVI